MTQRPLLSAVQCEIIEHAIRQMAEKAMLLNEQWVSDYIQSTRFITDTPPDPVLPRLLNLADIDAMQRQYKYCIHMAELLAAMQKATKEMHDAMLNRGHS